MITLEEVKQRAETDARTRGYYLNPNIESLNDLLEGLRRNEERYGYPSCPCRLASGKFELDRDIFCPCDYRDPDVEEFGYCYCGLYLRTDAFKGSIPISTIPERRPPDKQKSAYSLSEGKNEEKKSPTILSSNKDSDVIRYRIWYCKQCGYVCFREEPPYMCPICQAKREMFSEMHIRLTS